MDDRVCGKLQVCAGFSVEIKEPTMLVVDVFSTPALALSVVHF